MTSSLSAAAAGGAVQDGSESAVRDEQTLQQQEHERYADAEEEEGEESSSSLSSSASSASPTSSSSTLAPTDPASALCRVVEIALSNTSLWKQSLLLDELCRYPDYYVRLEVLLRLPSISSLTSDTAELITAIQRSSKLILSDDHSMVRRTLPLPPYESMPDYTRAIHVSGLPPGSSETTVRKLFDRFGLITYILRSDLVVKWFFASSDNDDNDNADNADNSTERNACADETTNSSGTNSTPDASATKSKHPDPTSGFTKAFVVFEKPQSCARILATIAALRETRSPAIRAAASPSPADATGINSSSSSSSDAPLASPSSSPAPASTSPLPASPSPESATPTTSTSSPSARSSFSSSAAAAAAAATTHSSRSSLSASSPDFIPRFTKHLISPVSAPLAVFPLSLSPAIIPGTAASLQVQTTDLSMLPVSALSVGASPSSSSSLSALSAAAAATSTPSSPSPLAGLSLTPEEETTLSHLEVLMKGDYIVRQKALATQLSITRLKQAKRTTQEAARATRAEAMLSAATWRASSADSTTAAAGASASSTSSSSPSTPTTSAHKPLRRSPFAMQDDALASKATKKAKKKALAALAASSSASVATVQAATAAVAAAVAVAVAVPDAAYAPVPSLASISPSPADGSADGDAAASKDRSSKAQRLKNKDKGKDSMASGASTSTTNGASDSAQQHRPRFSLIRSTATAPVVSRFAIGPDDPTAKGFTRGRGKLLSPAVVSV